MIAWILYDIQNNKAREKVAKLCKQAGLYRVQLSCFLGQINQNDLDTLSMQLEEWIDEDNDKLYIFPMSKNELKQTQLMGQAFDKKLITEEVRALWF